VPARVSPAEPDNRITLSAAEETMSRYKSSIALNLSAFLLMLGVGMIVALLPRKIIDLSNSVSPVGYLASAFAVTYVLAQVPIGNLSDKVGFKLILTLGYLLCGLTGLLYYWAGTSTLIFLGRSLQGIGEVPIWALAPALLSLHHPKAKGRAIGIYNASFHLGLSAGPVLGLLLLQNARLGNAAFLFYAGVSFAGSLIVYLFVENPRSSEVIRAGQFDLNSILMFVTNRLTLVVLAGIALYGAGYGLAITLVPAFLISAKGFSQASTSVYFSLFYLAISLSQLVVGPFSDKRGRAGFMVFGLVAAAIGLAVFSPLQPPWIIACLTLASLGLGMFCVSSLAYLNERVSDSLKGTISGAYYLFWGLGYFLAPLVAGELGNSVGLSVSFYSLAALLGVEAILLIVAGASRPGATMTSMQPSGPAEVVGGGSPEGR
jgi:MFS family permease